jgi:hypothetical protein
VAVSEEREKTWGERGEEVIKRRKKVHYLHKWYDCTGYIKSYAHTPRSSITIID